MKIKVNNMPVQQLMAEQNIKTILDSCEALENLYITTNEEIDLEVLMKFQDFCSFIKGLKNEIK